MLIKHRRVNDIDSSEITPKAIYYNRRKFLNATTTIGSLLAFNSIGFNAFANQSKFSQIIKSRWTKEFLGEDLTTYDAITNYNNFYEFGTSKSDPAKNSQDFKPKPWTVKIDGFCENPGTYAYEDVIKIRQLEERIYRLRCVEAWSMVIPWVGIPLAKVIKKFRPTSNAKYVAFETLYDPEQMPGQRRQILQWPYREGLRLDEAVNQLTLLAVGVYGEELPNQNGAPIRLVVPWKYGFKSIKSIVRITFVDKMPSTSWNTASSREYGFFSNVNPKVSHPRWSQSRERRIGNFLKQPTLMFNGYEEEVAELYEGMDLKKYF